MGKSETIGSSTNLFASLDKKVKIFVKKSEVTATAIFDVNYQPEEQKERMAIKLPARPRQRS